MVASRLDDEVGGTDGEYLQVFATELGRHGEVVVVGPLFVFHVQGRHGRVVGYLVEWGVRGSWEEESQGLQLALKH